MSVIPKIQGQQCAIVLFLTVCGKNTSVKCCGLGVSRAAEQPGAETIPEGAGWAVLALDTSPAGWPELAQDPSWCCPAAPGLLHRIPGEFCTFIAAMSLQCQGGEGTNGAAQPELLLPPGPSPPAAAGSVLLLGHFGGCVPVPAAWLASCQGAGMQS